MLSIVPGDSVAGNRGADFVQCLAPALRAGTRHWTRLRSLAVRRQACSHPLCSRVSAAIMEQGEVLYDYPCYHKILREERSIFSGSIRICEHLIDCFNLKIAKMSYL